MVKILLILVVASMFPSFTRPQFKRKLALVIGISHYRYLDYLRCALNDATDMAAELEKAGYIVTLLPDADAKTMEQAIEKFCMEATGSESVFFYFSGHGTGVQGECYLLPSDIGAKSARTPPTTLAVTQIKKRFDKCDIGTCITMVDVCRLSPSDPAIKTKLNLWQMNDDDYLKNRFYSIFSCEAADSSVEYLSDRNSSYTGYFLLHVRDRKISINRVCRLANKDVRRRSHNTQIPEVINTGDDEIYLYDTTTAEDQSPLIDSSRIKTSHTYRSYIPFSYPSPANEQNDLPFYHHTAAIIPDDTRRRKFFTLPGDMNQTVFN